MKELSVFSLHFTGTFSTPEIYFTPETMNALISVQNLRCANDDLLWPLVGDSI
jgi:hypothetical protein